MLRKWIMWLCLLLFLSFAGCVISPRRDSTTTNSGGSTNFSLAANPNSQIVAAGANASFTINVTFQNGFAGTVNLSASGVPSTMQAAFSANSVSGASGSSTLSVSTNVSTPTGTSTVIVKGADANSGASQSLNLTITVQ